MATDKQHLIQTGVNSFVLVDEKDLTDSQRAQLLQTAIDVFMSLPNEQQNQFVLSIQPQPNKATA